MSEADVHAWVDSGLPMDDGNLLEIALQWRAAGFTPASAGEWIVEHDWKPEDALPWYLAEYTPRQAYFAATLALYSFLAAGEDSLPPSTAEEWATSALSPEDVCRSLAAAVATVEEAEELCLRGLRDAQVIHDLYIKGDALGADARALILHPDALLRRFGSRAIGRGADHVSGPIRNGCRLPAPKPQDQVGSKFPV